MSREVLASAKQERSVEGGGKQQPQSGKIPTAQTQTSSRRCRDHVKDERSSSSSHAFETSRTTRPAAEIPDQQCLAGTLAGTGTVYNAKTAHTHGFTPVTFQNEAKDDTSSQDPAREVIYCSRG
jgi:hypothetical protein